MGKEETKLGVQYVCRVLQRFGIAYVEPEHFRAAKRGDAEAAAMKNWACRYQLTHSTQTLKRGGREKVELAAHVLPVGVA